MEPNKIKRSGPFAQFKYELNHFTESMKDPLNGKDWKEIYAYSCFPRLISPGIMLAIRFIIGLTYFVYFIHDLYMVAVKFDMSYFAYLTIWGFLTSVFWSVCVFGVSAAAYYYKNRDSSINSSQNKNTGAKKGFFIFMDALTSLTLNLNLIVVLLYWGLLAPALTEIPMDFDNFFKHLITYPLVAILHLISNMPLPLNGIIYSGILGLAYITNLTIIHLTQAQIEPGATPGVVYSIIDFTNNKNSSIITTVIVFLVIPIFHAFSYLCFGWHKNNKIYSPYEPGTFSTNHELPTMNISV